MVPIQATCLFAGRLEWKVTFEMVTMVTASSLAASTTSVLSQDTHAVQSFLLKMQSRTTMVPPASMAIALPVDENPPADGVVTLFPVKTHPITMACVRRTRGRRHESFC